MAASGTRKLSCTVLRSATKPMIGGRNAPPTMAVTISPDSSLVCSGMASTAIEKTSGKMFANPSPTRKKLADGHSLVRHEQAQQPTIDSTQVTRKNALRGDIQFRITPPENRPMVRAVKNRPVPSSPTLLMSMSKRSLR